MPCYRHARLLFKAEPLPEDFFAKHHAGFIEAVCGRTPASALPTRPESPWGFGGRPGGTSWATDEDIAQYQRAFADPMSHFHAISYYRYGLPFHIVHEDASAAHGERFEFLSERKVAEMWLHPEGLEKHPLHINYMDYGPEDRHKTFANPTLWMFGSYLARSRGTSTEGHPADRIPTGNPFSDQFSRYFPDLRGRRIEAGHFFPEEAPKETSEVLAGFLARLGALALAGFCILTALLFHSNWADFNEAIQFQKDICMAGGFLVLTAFGPGLWSIDAWLARRGWRGL